MKILSRLVEFKILINMGLVHWQQNHLISRQICLYTNRVSSEWHHQPLKYRNGITKLAKKTVTNLLPLKNVPAQDMRMTVLENVLQRQEIFNTTAARKCFSKIFLQENFLHLAGIFVTSYTWMSYNLLYVYKIVLQVEIVWCRERNWSQYAAIITNIATVCGYKVRLFWAYLISTVRVKYYWGEGGGGGCAFYDMKWH